MTTAPLTLTAARALPPGSWVPDSGLTAQVIGLEQKTAQKTGKPFWVAKLQDPANPTFSVEMAVFRAPAFRQGDVLLISGKGVKLENGQYGEKLKNSDQTQIMAIQPVTPTTASAGSPILANPAPHAALPSPGVVQGPELNGQARGNALSNAVQIIIHNRKVSEQPVIQYDGLASELWEVASQILEAAKGLETGVKPNVEDVPY